MKGETMLAWYYHRGRLQEIDGEHPGVIASVYKGKARVRFHEDTETLAVQARSRHICRQAVAAVLDEGQIMPSRINAEWPGQFIECWIQEWS
jgi:hypothetical protein